MTRRTVRNAAQLTLLGLAAATRLPAQDRPHFHHMEPTPATVFMMFFLL